jgi:hypothetical protein
VGLVDGDAELVIPDLLLAACPLCQRSQQADTNHRIHSVRRDRRRQRDRTGWR